MGLTEGNIFQGELSPRAAVLQPAGAGLGALPDARRATCGWAAPAAHPGGGIMGAHGRLAGASRLAQRRAAAKAGLTMAEPDRDAGTRSSSAAATTGWSRPRYLARAGLATLVWSAASASAAPPTRPSSRPGARVPTLAHTVGRLRPSVVRDLGLREHGLRLVAPEIARLRAAPDGAAIALWRDPARTADGLRRRSRPTPRRSRVRRRVRSLGRVPRRPRRQTPPDSGRPAAAMRCCALRLGPRVPRPRPRRRPARSCASLPMAVADFVDDTFETDAVRGGHRLARRPVHGDGAAVGRHDQGAARRLGRQRRRRGRRDGLRPRRPGALADCTGRRRPGRGRRDPHRRRGRAVSSERRPGRPAWSSPTARRSRRRHRRRRHRPEAHC